MKSFTRALAILAIVCVASPRLKSQQLVQITIQDLAPTSPLGLYFSPVWLGFHNGAFDLFNPGTAASPAIEALAELGNSSLINTAFIAAQPLGKSLVVNDPAGPPPMFQFVPGHSVSFTIDLNSINNRYLSYGLMVVPSNDTFSANAGSTDLPLFDAVGNFLGAQSWTITGAQVWDAGTELNNPLNGGAFVAGVDATISPAEDGLIHLQPANGLDNVIGLTTPAGTVIGTALSSAPLLRISVAAAVPEPSTYGLVAVAALAGMVAWRRRRTN